MPTSPREPRGSDEFTTFMRAYQDMVFSTAARLTANDTQAEDIAQDVFVRAFERFAQLRDSATAGGWLKTVTTHLALNYLSRHRRRWRLFSELPSQHPEQAGCAGDTDPTALLRDIWSDGQPDGQFEGPPDALAEIGAEQRRALVDDALRALPAHQRVPLVLYHFEELSYDEIAAQLRISLAKVKTDIHRGRAALLTILQAGGWALDALTE